VAGIIIDTSTWYAGGGVEKRFGWKWRQPYSLKRFGPLNHPLANGNCAAVARTSILIKAFHPLSPSVHTGLTVPILIS